MANNIDLPPNDEAILKRILAQPTLEGIILANEQGQFQYTTLDNNLTFLITSKLLAFSALAHTVIRDLNPNDTLITCRLRTKEKEMIVVTPPDSMRAIAIQRVAPSVVPTAAENEYAESFWFLLSEKKKTHRSITDDFFCKESKHKISKENAYENH